MNKPQGLTVHAGAGNYTGTLVNALLYRLHSLSSINGVVRPGIVHRIDKDTSGLLVVAKNDAAHRSLAEQIAVKTCSREYLASCAFRWKRGGRIRSACTANTSGTLSWATPYTVRKSSAFI